ncbi:MAG: hypothetical protein ACK5XX_00555 [Holosporales bacterium]|jgi:hypothetical protein|nr:hypothetical protein [Thalassospira sp.]
MKILYKNQSRAHLAQRTMMALRNSCDADGVWYGHKRQTATDNGMHWLDFTAGFHELLNDKRIEHYNGGYRIVGWKS